MKAVGKGVGKVREGVENKKMMQHSLLLFVDLLIFNILNVLPVLEL
jgi:hypothetical protein